MSRILPILAVVLLAVPLMGASILFHFATLDSVAGVVILEKERIVERASDGKMSSKYLIFTDAEVFENTDSLLGWKFNSSDVYRDIQVGKTCNFEVTGWRWPIFSMYRNILSAECR